MIKKFAIHKDFKKPPGRPIVSSIGCPTEKASQFIDILLRPYAQSGKSFIRDTPDFITKIRNIKLHPDDWLFSMDITSLYTNIPHEEGIDAVRKTIQEKTGNPTNSHILKLLRCVLEGNVFHFNDDFYIQTNGTAMGTRVAPTYAIIFINRLEEDHIYKYPKQPKYWFRFIDDVWGIF